jgi:hypothetical protein
MNQSVNRSVKQPLTISNSQACIYGTIVLDDVHETPDSSVSYILTAFDGNVSIKLVFLKSPIKKYQFSLLHVF